MNLKGTGSVRATPLAKLWLTATCWQSKLTSALGYSGASWEGMQSCIDYTAGFSQTILFEPGWHWECCCSTVTMKHSGQVPVYHHRTEQRRPPVPNCFPYLFRKHLFSGAVPYWSICIAFVLCAIISTYTFGARINWVTFLLLCSAMYVQCTG